MTSTSAAQIVLLTFEVLLHSLFRDLQMRTGKTAKNRSPLISYISEEAY